MIHPRRSTKRKFYERVTRACDMCRRKKMKCDQKHPCQTCQDRGFHCTYTPGRIRKSTEGPESRHAGNQREVASTSDERSDLDQCQNLPGHIADPLVSPPPTLSPEDTIGGKNIHTTGTEFYGSSSNFVLLSQLLSKARMLLGNQGETSNTATNTPVSIVDILYDSQSTIPDPRSPTPVTAAGRTSQFFKDQLNLSTEGDTPFSIRSAHTNPNIRDAFRQGHLGNCFIGNPMRLEMKYVNLFFQNIHTSLPFLDQKNFVARCHQEVWVESSVKQLRRDQMHFFALYNAVLAVASLTASTDAFRSLRQELEFDMEQNTARLYDQTPSSLHLSKLYFWRARHLLGDLCEVSSIESTQALLLMSIYCQHALRPHACYMYSGMTVRSALAIGLQQRNLSRQDTDALTAVRTWEAIYVQDIEISCSSGKPSTLSEPDAYGLTQPREVPHGNLSESSTGEGLSEDALLAVLIDLSAVVQRASRQLYHRFDSASMDQKSWIATELDQQLMEWRSRLPLDLSSDYDSFSESELSAKQRLNLQIRFNYTRMFIHRPFLSAAGNEDTQDHTAICLSAAQETIKLIYDAYKHRYYFRTWWHNTIQVLYASLVLLFVLLRDDSEVPINLLSEDVEKAIRILDSMKDMKTAGRCTDLIKEIYHITRCYVDRRRQTHIESLPEGHIEDFNGLNNAPHEDYLAQDNNYHENLSLNPLAEDILPMRNDILACFEDLGAVENFAIDIDGFN